MLVNFKKETYNKLQHLASAEGKSVAAFVSSVCDNIASQKVVTTYSIKKEENNNV